jgi:hypothetical protein
LRSSRHKTLEAQNEPRRTVDADNEGLEAPNGTIEGMVMQNGGSDSHHFDEEQEQDQDPVKSWIPIKTKKNSDNKFWRAWDGQKHHLTLLSLLK